MSVRFDAVSAFSSSFETAAIDAVVVSCFTCSNSVRISFDCFSAVSCDALIVSCDAFIVSITKAVIGSVAELASEIFARRMVSSRLATPFCNILSRICGRSPFSSAECSSSSDTLIRLEPFRRRVTKASTDSL